MTKNNLKLNRWFYILQYIHNTDGFITVTNIAKKTDTTYSYCYYVIRDLVRKNILSTEKHGRRLKVSITKDKIRFVECVSYIIGHLE